MERVLARVSRKQKLKFTCNAAATEALAKATESSGMEWTSEMSYIETRGPDFYTPHCPVIGRRQALEKGYNLR